MARLMRIAKRHWGNATRTVILESLDYSYRPSISSSRRYSKSANREVFLSPITANILRIIRNQIENLIELTPPYQPWESHECFEVKDRPAEQWISLKKLYSDNEELDLEATMFDGMKTVTRNGNNDTFLHITLVVRISKQSYKDDRALEFLCSAWPKHLEIHKVYFVESSDDNHMIHKNRYSGRDFRNMSFELQNQLQIFLKERGVSDQLCHFLHYYMLNKDKIELLTWLGKLHDFLEK